MTYLFIDALIGEWFYLTCIEICTDLIAHYSSLYRKWIFKSAYVSSHRTRADPLWLHYSHPRPLAQSHRRRSILQLQLIMISAYDTKWNLYDKPTQVNFWVFLSIFQNNCDICHSLIFSINCLQLRDWLRILSMTSNSLKKIQKQQKIWKKKPLFINWQFLLHEKCHHEFLQKVWVPKDTIYKPKFSKKAITRIFWNFGTSEKENLKTGEKFFVLPNYSCSTAINTKEITNKISAKLSKKYRIYG